MHGLTPENEPLLKAAVTKWRRSLRQSRAFLIRAFPF